MGDHDERDRDVRKGWATLRRQFALALMFFGAVAILSWVLDRVFVFQRPTNPLAAFTLGPGLIAAGFLLDRGALRSPVTGGREPPAP